MLVLDPHLGETYTVMVTKDSGKRTDQTHNQFVNQETHRQKWPMPRCGLKRGLLAKRLPSLVCPSHKEGLS